MNYFKSAPLPRFPLRRGRESRRMSIAESVNNSRPAVIVNMVVDMASALVLFTGLVYVVKFLFFWRKNMAEVTFNLFFGALILFAAGWLFFTVSRYSRYLEQLRRLSEEARRNARENARKSRP